MCVCVFMSEVRERERERERIASSLTQVLTSAGLSSDVTRNNFFRRRGEKPFSLSGGRVGHPLLLQFL